MTDPFSWTTVATAVVSGLIQHIGKKVLARTDRAIEGAAEETQQWTQNTVVVAVAEKYAKKYGQRHGQLKILRMREPIPLEDVYTAVKLLDNYSIRDYLTPYAMEELYRQGNRRRFSFSEDKRVGGLEIANQKQYLTVVGGPGAGKSTFLRKVGLEALKGRQGEFRQDRLPVFLELKRFDRKEVDIQSLIAEEFRTCGLPYPEKFVKEALEQGKLLVLLDGLDEVPSRNLARVVEKIQDFVDRYSDNWFIASCRSAAYRNCGGLRQFTDIAIAEFDDEQIEQFARNWFRGETDLSAGTADTFWDLLNRDENKSAKELAQTPLLLTFLCLVYDRSQNLITNRAALYGKALDILLEEWAAEKRVRRGNIYEGLHPRLEKVLLSEIAYTSFEEDRLFFTGNKLIHEISDFLAGTLDAPKHLDGKKVLDAIEVQQGILVERVEGVYSFSHLTLQEYLTARYIAQHSERIQKLVEHHLHDPRWKEVFLLVAGLLDKGDKFLNLIVDSHLKFPPPRKLMEWIEKNLESNSTNTNPLEDRVLALYLSLSLDQARALSRARALDRARAKSLDRSLDRSRALALGLSRARAQALDRDLDLARTLDLELDLALSHALSRAQTIDRLNIFSTYNVQSVSEKIKSLRKEIRDEKITYEIYIRYFNEVISILCEALHLGLNAIDLSLEGYESLSKCLDTCILLVNCKKASVRVSPTVWENVQNRMLRPIESTTR